MCTITRTHSSCTVTGTHSLTTYFLLPLLLLLLLRLLLLLLPLLLLLLLPLLILPLAGIDDFHPAATLTLEQLTCLVDTSKQDKKHTEYAANGTNKSRLRDRLRGKGTCSCKNKCYSQFSIQALTLLCHLFWSVSKSAQDALLWSMACTRPPSSSKQKQKMRRSWWLDGKEVCGAKKHAPALASATEALWGSPLQRR